jgi:hypothetical protein
MFVAMVDVGEVGVAMNDRKVLVPVGMRLFGIYPRGMRVLMVFVMRVRVRVGQILVAMRVFVPLGQMEPDSSPHQSGSQQK